MLNEYERELVNEMVAEVTLLDPPPDSPHFQRFRKLAEVLLRVPTPVPMPTVPVPVPMPKVIVPTVPVPV
jgi:hypothetical protein